ncbi:hypothetical protein OQ968_09220 [Mycobacterium sp. 663a-19]|uniref:hypothetical protein n=1 Tax=Mycobacterium sp. 663a-19 TaxID=2986148 RepID=UPI002D1EAE30|nr:hypothetical protein [Mycobacterium sp. 663a-19]MEB3981441.1 hypothetical protein [Mycobacterium sp. 663a-19]
MSVLAVSGKVLTPPPGTARQLKDVPDRTKRVNRVRHLLDLPVPLRGIVRAVIVAATALPPLIVLRSPCPVERTLIGQQIDEWIGGII